MGFFINQSYYIHRSQQRHEREYKSLYYKLIFIDVIGEKAELFAALQGASVNSKRPGSARISGYLRPQRRCGSNRSYKATFMSHVTSKVGTWGGVCPRMSGCYLSSSSDATSALAMLVRPCNLAPGTITR